MQTRRNDFILWYRYVNATFSPRWDYTIGHQISSGQGRELIADTLAKPG
jgi:hypothetical protein